MKRDYFWLTDEQFAHIKPHLPTDTRGKARVDDRRVISGIARNAIERMFCRLKDFRRIATRYDRLAANFLAAVCIAATVSYW
jgi:transposase